MAGLVLSGASPQSEPNERGVESLRLGSFQRVSGCRSCGSKDLETVLDMGALPLADGLLADEGEIDGELRYPLTLVRCRRCTLVQIRETVAPETLFAADYPYYSSFSETLVEHSRQNVESLIDRYRLDRRSFVVELASNDGYLLQWFQKAGIRVLGIDPAPGPAAAARERGVPTLCEFFTPEVADRVAAEEGRADLIIGNNVLAHVPDQNQFVDAIGRLLAREGVVVMEFPYVRDLIGELEFDTVYHEHHCYFSVTSARALFERHGLSLFRVEHLPIHGGSLRVFLARSRPVEPSVTHYLEAEQAEGVNDSRYYADFALRVAETGATLKKLIGELNEAGNSVAAYGAAAKGTVMLNYARIGKESLKYVVDRNVYKQGRLMPGIHLPIVGPEALRSEPPDYLLILVWNLKEEIIRQQGDFMAAGGRFIVPLPSPQIL